MDSKVITVNILDIKPLETKDEVEAFMAAIGASFGVILPKETRFKPCVCDSAALNGHSFRETSERKHGEATVRRCAVCERITDYSLPVRDTTLASVVDRQFDINPRFDVESDTMWDHGLHETVW